MKIQFWGGTGTVTGSRFLLSTENSRVLVDCGLYQGYKWLRERNWRELPFDIRKVDAIVLTHAHLDHSGYVPVVYQQGYRGPVFCHRATRELCRILWKDSGHLQEEDARFLAKHKLSKHHPPKPLYDMRTAVDACKLLKAIRFHETVQVGDIRFHLQPAGHILGAGSVIAEAGGKTVGFSGDVGRPDDLLMRAPEPLPALDLLLLESTYGDRRHTDVTAEDALADIVNDTVKTGGAVVVPCFAVGRAQLMQHMLTRLKAAGRIPGIPVYLDSPMAIDVSDIYCRHSELHRLSAEECAAFSDGTIYTDTVEASKAIADQHYPHVILAGSGMATGGRVLHHLKRLLGDHRTTVMFTGYQAGGTRGARLMKGEEAVKIHGQYIPVRARVEMLDGLSGHADYVEIREWLKGSKLRPRTRIQLIHGEPDAADALRIHLQENTDFDVAVAEYGHSVTV